MAYLGTGKTTIARTVAEVLRSLGVLRVGHLVEADRSSLIAGYVGQTAIKTHAVVQSALGGVLFIDEAYSLVSNDKDTFGREALDTLVKLLEAYLETYAQSPALAGLTDQAVFHDLAATNPALATDREGHVFLNACCPRGALRRGLAAWNASAEAYDRPAARAAPAFLHWNGNVGEEDPTRAMLMSAHARVRAPRACPGVVRVLGAQGVAEDYHRHCDLA